VRLAVVQQGRLRDPAIAALTAEYRKRFARFGRLDIVEREAGKDAKPLWPTSARWKVALDESGTAVDSRGLAALLTRWTAAHGEVAFLVGDAYGLHAPSRAVADTTLSLGPLTLPHQLAHLVLVEQLYRAATILAGTSYHHGEDSRSGRGAR